MRRHVIDVIVIGGGHNGLTAAAYLARAGRRVVVLERRPEVGGAAVTEEVFPGFHISVCAYVVSLLRPEIIRELDLRRHGLQLLPLAGTFTPGTPGPARHGNYLWRPEDPASTYRELARHSTRDAERYADYVRTLAEIAAFVKPVLAMTPPDPMGWDPSSLLGVLDLGKRFRKLSEANQRCLVQLMTMSAADFVEQWFESDLLKGTLSASGIIGTFQGVRSPGTAYVLLHHYMGEIDGHYRSWGIPVGGTGAVSKAIAAAAREAGVEVRTRATVGRITTKRGRVTGVVLESGEQLEAATVVSTVDPRLTFLKLVDSDELPVDFVADVKRVKYRGASAKVNLALDGLPDFTCLTGLPGDGPHLGGAISISPSVDYIERAYDEAKYGSFSRRPFLDVVIPTLSDPSLAPQGKHILSCFVQYAPYELADGTWDTQREALGDAVVNTLAEYAPNMRNIVLHRQVVTPLDLEREFGLTEGNIFHGELSLEQLFFLRPVPGWAQYKTPIKNLWMGGAAAHPGGGIMGAPGRNCARRILGR